MVFMLMCILTIRVFNICLPKKSLIYNNEDGESC